ncbi:MAG: glycosyltransferase [Chloroflexaceae bacterium]|nr:glycosyltransferase [Chloroflexaceae bacterium]
MRICYFGTYEHDYPRNEIIIAGLRQAGITVYECHEPVWSVLRERNRTDQDQGWTILSMSLRVLRAYARLVVRYLRMPRHDILMVGYVGQFDMLVAWVLNRLKALPMVFNPMLSLYDTVCHDRMMVNPSSLVGRAIWLLDYLSCQAADVVLIDTKEHARYFVETFRLPASKLRVVPLGADDRQFHPRPLPPPCNGRPCEVVFVGKFIPLQGCLTIAQAAAILRDAPVHFTLVGTGQDFVKTQLLVNELNLTNVTMTGWVDYAQIPDYYAMGDICLGIFGSSTKTTRVVPNKVYEGLAVGRPVLTANTPALRSELCPGEEVWVCRPSDPADLARQIVRLANDEPLRQQLACRGYAAFQQRYSVRAIGEQVYQCLSELVPGAAPKHRMAWGVSPAFDGRRRRFRENSLYRAIRRYAPGRTVLDAAYGDGSLARRLVASGYSVIGLGCPCRASGSVGYRQPGERVSLLQGDVTRIPCHDGAVDGVIASGVLEHLPDDHGPLREIWRVLRPGGVCVISVPAGTVRWNGKGSRGAGRVRGYRREDMQRVLEAQGFLVLRLRHAGFPLVRAFRQYLSLPRFDELPDGVGLIAVAQKPGR